MYLFIKNLKNKKKKIRNWIIKKLISIIKRKKNDINYELELSKKIKIHLVFYILVLESVDPRILIQNKSTRMDTEKK